MREVRHPDGRVVLAGVPNEAVRLPGESTRDAAGRMFARCDAERWDRRKLAAGLLGLAALCDGADPASLQLLSVVEEISPEFAAEHLEARKLICAGLLAGRSRGLAAQGQSAEAMRIACGSASSYLDLNLPELAIPQ